MTDTKQRCRLTKLRVDEVSAVDKGANGKTFLILKRAEPEPEKADPGAVRSWFRDAIRKVAGVSGPDDGGTEMTADEIKKAVQEAAEAALAPIVERVEKLETLPAEGAEGEPIAPVEKIDGEPAAEPADTPLTAEAVAKLVADAVTDAVAPLVKRLETVETAAGQRQSGLPEGAHQVRKADGSFSWQGSGLI